MAYSGTLFVPNCVSNGVKGNWTNKPHRRGNYKSDFVTDKKSNKRDTADREDHCWNLPAMNKLNVSLMITKSQWNTIVAPSETLRHF
jgi:hypothetical protein